MATSQLRRPESLASTSTTKTFHFKLVLLGDASVGKSCLVVRFAKNEFFEYQEPTIGGKQSNMLLRKSKQFLEFSVITHKLWPLSPLFVDFSHMQSKVVHRLFLVAAFMTQSVQIPDAIVRFEIWDTAG